MNAVHCKNDRNGEACNRYLGALTGLSEGQSVDYRCPACRGHTRNIRISKQNGRITWEAGIDGNHRAPELPFDKIITLAEVG